MQENKLVYSTEIGRIKPKVESSQPPKGDSIVRLRRETKGRKGKGVTSISGLQMAPDELKSLCTKLKKTCGTGGAIKGDLIEIQGDNRDKIKALLEKQGLTVKLAGG